MEPSPPRTLDRSSLAALAGAIERLEQGFRHLPPQRPIPDPRIDAVLAEVAERMQDNYPYFHALYAGQMLKPPHPVARAAAALADWINPNNHALDGGRASSRMEKEAVAEIASMFGWRSHLGHLCSGGTMANLEALWVGRELRPGTRVAASSQAHYTHRRIGAVLGIEFEEVACDRLGRMDLRDLERHLEGGRIGTVVATMGTTATGSVDPLPELLDLCRRFGVRVHADAAYGGYFGLIDELSAGARAAFDSLGDADSIVIDPHKHGLQPYGCGCVLFRDPAVGRFYQHESPYTYFTSNELHLGEISLECSRPGAAAVALWATQRLLPLVKGGEFARSLQKSREAALALHERLRTDRRFVTAFAPELDIVVWAPRADRASEMSRRARLVFDEAARLGLHLALAQLPTEFFDLEEAGIDPDAATVICLRSVLMKPEHLDWIDRIWLAIDRAANASMAAPAAR